MTRPRLAAACVAFAFSFYMIAFSLLSAYVDKTGFFCLLFIIPLAMMSLFFGTWPALLAMAAGAVFNMFVWLTWGGGRAFLLRDTESAVAGIVLECVLYLSVVFATDRFTAARRQLAQSHAHASRALKLLEQSERQFRTLIEMAPEGIAIIVDGKIAYANDCLMQMNGYDRSTIRGKDISDFLLEEDVRKTKERFAARLDGSSEEGAFTVRYKSKDGKIRWVSATGRKIDWNGAPAVIYFITDITERKALEAGLAQSQKMEAVGRLASGIAHDFNNVLQVILGTTTFMRDHFQDEQALERDLATIDDAATKAADHTRELLALSRKEAVHREIVDLRDVVRQHERMLDRILPENIRLAVEAPKEPSCVEGDAGQLGRVILNLAVNARDAMPEGGALAICLRNLPGQVELSVSDTGIGMDEETQSHLFEPFFTTKSCSEGSGLGLSIVYSIVKQNRGVISVESRPGDGSRFTVTLPSAPAAACSAAPSSRAESPATSGSILLVEDNDLVRRLVSGLLQKGGYHVTEAEDGKMALAICEHRQDVFDLLLTDLIMPGIGGTEVAARLGQMRPGTRVLYMTGHADGHILRECGDGAILYKPFSHRDLLASVRKAIHGEAHA